MQRKAQGECLSFLVFGFKKAVLLPLRVFSNKTFTVGAFVVPFKVLRRNKTSGDDVLF